MGFEESRNLVDYVWIYFQFSSMIPTNLFVLLLLLRTYSLLRINRQKNSIGVRLSRFSFFVLQFIFHSNLLMFLYVFFLLLLRVIKTKEAKLEIQFLLSRYLCSLPFDLFISNDLFPKKSARKIISNVECKYKIDSSSILNIPYSMRNKEKETKSESKISIFDRRVKRKKKTKR